MTAANFDIRPAKVGDAGKLNRYMRLIYQTSDHLITLPTEFAVSTLKQRFWLAGKAVNPYETCLIASSEGKIAGALESWTDRRTRVCHVTTFAMSVHPDWRGRGVGTALLDSFVQWVAENPRLDKIELHVHDDNAPALALYRKFGFKTEGRRVGAVQYDNNRLIDDILMAYWPNSSNVEK